MRRSSGTFHLEQDFEIRSAAASARGEKSNNTVRFSEKPASNGQTHTAPIWFHGEARLKNPSG
jgi:hypothetical protein